MPDEPSSRRPKNYLRRIRIKNFKSFRDTKVTLEPFTIFIGQNGSGKSNFLEALRFVLALTGKGVNQAVQDFGGWRSVANIDGQDQDIDFELEFELGGIVGELHMAIGYHHGHGVKIHHESVTFTDTQKGETLCYNREDNQLKSAGSNQTFWTRTEELNEPFAQRLAPDYFGFPYLPFQANFLGSELAASAVYRFEPTLMRPLLPVESGKVSRADGTAIIYDLQLIEEVDPEQIDIIKKYLRLIVENVQDFHIQKYGEDFHTVRFSLFGKNRDPIEFNAANMSDGTLRTLGILAAIHRSHVATPHYGFTAIEEPETALHAAAVSLLTEALLTASQYRQILITTHSTELLDAEDVLPQHIRLVEMCDGETIIGPIDEVSRNIMKRHLDTLGGLARNRQFELVVPELHGDIEEPEVSEVTP
ncbi:MAG: AAA family ATPase [Fimbriiglobus sp.]